MAEQGKAKKVSVSLFEEELVEVRTLANVSGASFSGALRRIIHEWADMQQPVAAVDGRMGELITAYRKGLITPREFNEAARLEKLREGAVG